MTSRERVLRTLDFTHTGRVARDLWSLPWADMHHREALAAIRHDFPADITGAPGFHRERPRTQGDAYAIGTYVDAWGCTFENLQPGVIGEVKQPVSTEEDWSDIGGVHIPVELLSIDADQVNAFCRKEERFVMGGFCPRPFEQLQFIRGTEQLYIDLMDPPKAMLDFIGRMHAFYCEGLRLWAQTEVDALNFMDDWGTQRSLLINPALWERLFKPLYKDYIDIAHRAGKKIFFHSDGYTLSILPHLIGLGLDAINTQIFCMGLETVQPFAGQITFWGEMDRQHLLPYGTEAAVREAAARMKACLYRQGGLIAQLEFGAGAKPENVRAFYAAFDTL